MKFPLTVRFRKASVKIYGRSSAYLFYRVAFHAGGRRHVRSFSTYSEAKAEADAKVRDLANGKQSIGLTAKEAGDVLAIRDTLEAFRRDTGRSLTAIQAVTDYVNAAKLLSADDALVDVVRGYLRTVAVVQRKPLAEAVAEFCEPRKSKAVAPPGKRPALNPTYVADTARQLGKFAVAFPGMVVTDLGKAHLNAYVSAHGKLSSKSRNHLRSTLRMFLGWCVRRDYLNTHHRLLEADALQQEPIDAAPIDFYRPHELRALLETATGPMRAIIALQALAGLRLQEALRLDWHEVFGIAGYVEISTSKSKTRQRRLVPICSALAQWLAPYRGLEGKTTSQPLSGYSQSFSELRKSLNIPSRRNGLRHGFVTHHHALYNDENLTAAQAGNSPNLLHQHYRGLATRADAEKWFGVTPSVGLENIISLDAANTTVKTA